MEIKNSKGEKDFSKKIGQMGISDKRNNIAKAESTKLFERDPK